MASHLGAVIGSNDFKMEYFAKKVDKWCQEVRQLSEFAESQPHAAFSAYIHAQQHKYSYFARTVEGVSECFKPLDDLVTNLFIPKITGFNSSDQSWPFEESDHSPTPPHTPKIPKESDFSLA